MRKKESKREAKTAVACEGMRATVPTVYVLRSLRCAEGRAGWNSSFLGRHPIAISVPKPLGQRGRAAPLKGDGIA
ncbi:MAG: hypothetical protein A2806_02275 [Candidatus Terrybacteria bacterium RIFCSPHIGHO2_01_FULL_48_17]|uniref:Uncharacterized protein n=1 Tax=Candidatus Terrybacteria bacterium RIFCSPHIGHO2_01_FULL_48_17 TaxID=1802362 RepID=A0A1G2PHM9_9BACT|nr:MAG: hypothetical protein A2806_02275 [Candidatus Terrybacteria bacterium RIFCSPHIGHO2_01_FULL_48_17]OHA53573.1 MAG: hypothetical protein A3A30_00230 [Candidatus Terrybacteria bacterium RIFCSPLOWO2_01_FULL_48_14]